MNAVCVSFDRRLSRKLVNAGNALFFRNTDDREGVFGGDVTSLHVAHRLAAVARCDRVLVMEGGTVAEAGPPRELLRQRDPPSRFRRMVLAQGGGALEAEIEEEPHLELSRLNRSTSTAKA